MLAELQRGRPVMHVLIVLIVVIAAGALAAFLLRNNTLMQEQRSANNLSPKEELRMKHVVLEQLSASTEAEGDVPTTEEKLKVLESLRAQ